MISLPKAVLIGFTFETLLYGAFIVVFVISTNLQWRRYRKAPLTFGNKLTFVFSILLCFLITMHWVLNLWMIFEAFLQTPTPSATESVIADLGATKNLIKLTICKIQLLMGDAILIYRLYYVAGRKWIAIVPPALLYCTIIACISSFFFYISRFDFTRPQTLPATASLVKKLEFAIFSLAIVENTYCLVLIAFFIWKVHRDVCQITSSSLHSVMRIFIDSAGAWGFFFFLTFIVYLCNPHVSHLFLYPTSPVLGISFCMMTIRIQLRKKTAVVGSDNAKPPYFGNAKAISEGHAAYAACSVNAQNQLMVFSSNQTANDSILDITAPKVWRQ